MIYLDIAATSFYKPKSVKRAVYNSLSCLTANPGRSGHKPAQKIAEVIYDTRENLKRFFNAENYNAVFTKNCTEALNLAINGILKYGDHVITTIYEHNSVLRTLERMKRKGVNITILDCDMKDVCNEISKVILPNTKMVITTYVSNVTGEICDVASIGKICKANNIIYLVDGAQACGHVKINLGKDNIDMLTFSGHKGLLALTGVGGLLIKNGLSVQSLICGGTGTESENIVQPNDVPEGLESGTLPTISIVSLNAGLKFLINNFNKIQKKEEKISNYLKKSLKKLNFIKIYSKNTSKNVFLINIKNKDSSYVANKLNEKFNICVRSGLHCAPLIHKHLGTFETGAVRISIDFNNSIQDINRLIYALKMLCEDM